MRPSSCSWAIALGSCIGLPVSVAVYTGARYDLRYDLTDSWIYLISYSRYSQRSFDTASNKEGTVGDTKTGVASSETRKPFDSCGRSPCVELGPPTTSAEFFERCSGPECEENSSTCAIRQGRGRDA